MHRTGELIEVQDVLDLQQVLAGNLPVRNSLTAYLVKTLVHPSLLPSIFPKKLTCHCLRHF